MGKKIIWVVALLLGLHTTSQAQVYIDNMYKQANAMANATIKGDYTTLLKYTHPAMIKSMGGKEQAMATIKQGVAMLKSGSLNIKKVSIGKVTQTVVEKENIQCIVPQLMDMRIAGVDAHSNNYLLGITYDGGKNWYFMNTASSTPEKLRQFLPELNKKLTIPKSNTTYK